MTANLCTLCGEIIGKGKWEGDIKETIVLHCEAMVRVEKEQKVLVQFLDERKGVLEYIGLVSAAKRCDVALRALVFKEQYERRSSFKVKTSMSTTVTPLGALPDKPGYMKTGAAIQGHLHDISVGGAFITTETPLHVGALVEVRISAFGQELMLPAKVLRNQPAKGNLNGYGCCFSQITMRDEETLCSMLFRLQAMQSQSKT